MSYLLLFFVAYSFSFLFISPNLQETPSVQIGSCKQVFFKVVQHHKSCNYFSINQPT